MKVAYLIICISVLFFVFSCLLSIPPSYIDAAKAEGVTILSALSMLPNAPAWLSISGIIVAVVAMSKSFPVPTLVLLKAPRKSSKQHYIK